LEYTWITIGGIVVLVVMAIVNRIRREKELTESVKKSFGVAPTDSMTLDRYASLPAYLKSLPKADGDIDDITWNDLDMDRIFESLNHTGSAVGEEVLFAWLHKPEMRSEELIRREHLIDLFEHDADARLKAGKVLVRMGKMRRISVYDYMMRLRDVPKESNLRHYLAFAVYAVSVGMIIAGQEVAGFGLFMMTALFNILTYLKRKGVIEPYLEVVSYISRWIKSVRVMADELKDNENPELKEELSSLFKDTESFRSFVRMSGLLASSNPTGSVTELVMEYVRMLFHVDLIKFNRIIKDFDARQEELNRIFAGTGRIDASRAVASYRCYRKKYAVPILHDTPNHTVKAEAICHPLVADPVANSITADRPVLLTGSNASGKSTFLKTLAVNAILAQTIHTVLANGYEADYFKILSSMALRDDLATRESYYIVEIRSLKRIMDAAEENISVLCFVDEVLRGTNTAERIAASSRILRYLAEKKALVFAATHDLELTSLLADVYENYHFSEQVEEDIVVFDYRLKPGKATSRNALKLLEMMEYPKVITDDANKAVEGFLSTGEWN
jgi:DNA mismatch repair ATPase MutS